MSLYTILAIPAFTDNYFWLLYDAHTKKGAVVDPGDAVPVLSMLANLQIELEAILITHHHADHIGGVSLLKQAFPQATIYAAKNQQAITLPIRLLQEQDVVQLSFTQLRVLEIPGHTLDHIAYYDEQALFCGDTLFSAGCGRVFEGTMEQMYHTLQKIKQLPDALWVYCAHEYTAKNVQFALQFEPENPALQQRYQDVSELRQRHQATIPVQLGQEKAYNPFLRCSSPALQANVSKRAGDLITQEMAIFSLLRQWRNEF
jgi:hydroxyacylglutathione hydrolase